MSRETIFLQSTGSNSNSNPNFATATGFAVFSNYSQNPSGILTSAQAETLVRGGVSAAIANAIAIADFRNDPNFTALFTGAGGGTGVGLEGSFAGSANSEAKVVSSFAVRAGQTFSFNFLANLALKAKEIENRDTEYNEAQGKTTFVVLDTTNPNNPKLLDFFGIRGELISSDKDGNMKMGGGRNITMSNRNQTNDIDGNNGEDSITGDASGSYRRIFGRDTNITIVEVNASAISFAGDTLIGNLGQDVTYGTIRNDNRNGGNGTDKIYGSLGDDSLDGKQGDDILEGGQGNDRLFGDQGNDKLHGGLDNDELTGGRGNDILAGGEGSDQFIFRRGNSLLQGESDIIQDFQAGIDKLVFQGWGNNNAEQWLNQMFSQGKITNTNDGVLFNLDGSNGGTLLLAGLNSNQINSQSIAFG